MDFYKLNVFNNFHCIGSDCPNTCCGKWAIFIDEDSADYYLNYPGEFGDKLRENIIKENNKYLFKLLPNGKCPFLNEKNLCDIYINLGEDKMCNTCTQYPRGYRQITKNDVISTINISCPEAARMLFAFNEQLSVVSFTKGDQNNISQKNAIKKQTYFNGLIISLQILQTSTITISQRIKLMLFFNDMLEATMKKGENPTALLKDFSDASVYPLLASSLNEIAYNSDKVTKTVLLLCNIFSQHQKEPYLFHISMDVANEIHSCIAENRTIDVPGILKTIETDEYQSLINKYVCYEVFNNYFLGFDDSNLVTPLRLPVYLHIMTSFVIGFLLYKKTDFSPEIALQIYSCIDRYIEHNDAIKKQIYDVTSENHLFETADLLSIV